jgi:hypothetical protein
VHLGDELQDLAAAQVVVEDGRIGQIADAAFDFGGIGMAIEAVDQYPSAAGHQYAHHHADGGGLAGAVGAEEAEYFAAAYGAASAAGRRGTAVVFGQCFECNHAVSRAVRCWRIRQC